MENYLTMQPVSMTELMEIEGGVVVVILGVLAVFFALSQILDMVE
jgi:hypothetical protein